MKLSRKKKKLFRRIARVHFLLTVIAFGFYLSLSFFLGPKFLLSDVKEKFHVLADDIIMVSARVLAPPVEPVVTATPVCVTGASRVSLDWANDDNTMTWSIERDGLPLVSGLVLSEYGDTSVTNTTSYSYIVSAHGPMGPGIAVSHLVGATTLACGTIQPTPTLSIVSFEGMNIASVSQLSTPVLRPTFTGTTNIPNANIDILASSTDQVVSDHVIANGTGYWSWTPTVDLIEGIYTISVMATDPLDGTRVVSNSVEFTIERTPSSSNGNNTDMKKKKVISPPIVMTPPLPIVPFDFTLLSQSLIAYQGDTLDVSVTVSRIDSKFIGREATVLYDLIAPNGENKEHAESIFQLGTDTRLKMPLTIPLGTDPGDGYRIRTTLILGKYAVTREILLSVRPLPILQLGGGMSVTLPQMVAFSGWIAFALLTFLLLWLFLFIREYWLYLHAWRHITERQLIRLGFFGTRREVLR